MLRTRRLATAAALTAVPFTLAGPAVAAATPSPSASSGSGGTMSNVTPFAFQLSPTTLAPGGTLALGVTGCDAGSATASSGIFNTVNLPNTGTKGEYVGATSIDATAKPGAQYTVTFTCGSSSGTTTLTVTGGTTTTPTTMPNGAVKAGLGGTAHGRDTTEILAGTALAAAGLAGGLVLMRRRTTHHDS